MITLCEIGLLPDTSLHCYFIRIDIEVNYEPLTNSTHSRLKNVPFLVMIIKNVRGSELFLGLKILPGGTLNTFLANQEKESYSYAVIRLFL